MTEPTYDEAALREVLEGAGAGVDVVPAPVRTVAQAGESAWRRRRRRRWAAGVLVAAVATAGGVVAVGLHDSDRVVIIDDGPADPVTGLTDRQLKLGLDVGRSEAARSGDSVVRTVTVELRRGTVPGTNEGHACPAGPHLHVVVIGDFPQITVGGPPQVPGEPEVDLTVHAMVIEADPDTGQACLQGVQTGDVQPAPHAVVVYP